MREATHGGAPRRGDAREDLRALGRRLMEEHRKLLDGEAPDLNALAECRDALERIAESAAAFETALRARLLSLKTGWIAAQARRAEAARRYCAALDALRGALGPGRVHMWLDAEAALTDLLAAEAEAEEALGAAERLLASAPLEPYPSPKSSPSRQENPGKTGSSTTS